MDYRQQILSFLSLTGPSTPTAIGKKIGKDSLMTSAMLAELKASGKIKMSNLKVGSTPLYYTSDHEDKLQNFSSYLHEKEQKTLALLQDQKIIRDTTTDPLTQQCLRSIKDFAIPLTVTFQNNKEIFWKWYLLKDEEINPLLNSILNPSKPHDENSQPIANEPLKQNEIQEKNDVEITPEKEEGDEIDVLEKNASQKKEETQQKNVIKKQASQKTKQETLQSEASQNQGHDDEFYTLIKEYCNQKEINIHSSVLIKKKKEFNMIVSFSSVLGDVHYFCKAKNKKRISPEDISTAYLEAQDQKLPVLLLSPGELTKKAAQVIEQNLKGVKFSQV